MLTKRWSENERENTTIWSEIKTTTIDITLEKHMGEKIILFNS